MNVYMCVVDIKNEHKIWKHLYIPFSLMYVTYIDFYASIYKHALLLYGEGVSGL